ncbi:MAG TPA: ABC transporter substrate-binding protein, partial [Chloroflexota bacterium]
MATLVRHAAIAALAAIIVVGSFGCATPRTDTPATLVFGTPLQPNTLNPITAPDLASRYVIEMLFDGLVASDEKLQLHGALASDWEASPDGTAWTFHLRKGVLWHDGPELTSDDVKFTYDTVVDPATKPTVAKSDFASIRQVVAVDRYTVRFDLRRPDAALLSRLTLGIAPRHLLQ